MLENVKPAKLTKYGKLTISGKEMYAEGFRGNDGCSCRDVAALALIWAIGKLQRELALTLRAPDSGRKMGLD